MTEVIQENEALVPKLHHDHLFDIFLIHCSLINLQSEATYSEQQIGQKQCMQ